MQINPPWWRKEGCVWGGGGVLQDSSFLLPHSAHQELSPCFYPFTLRLINMFFPNKCLSIQSFIWYCGVGPRASNYAYLYYNSQLLYGLLFNLHRSVLLEYIQYMNLAMLHLPRPPPSPPPAGPFPLSLSLSSILTITTFPSLLYLVSQ